MYPTNEYERFSISQNNISVAKPLRPLIQYYEYIFSNKGLQFNASIEIDTLKTLLINKPPSIITEKRIKDIHHCLQTICDEAVNVLHEKMKEEKQHSEDTCTVWTTLYNISSYESQTYTLILAIYLAEQTDFNYVEKYLPFILSSYICNQQKIFTHEYTDCLYPTILTPLQNDELFKKICTFLNLKKNRKNLFNKCLGVKNLPFSKIETYIKNYTQRKTSNNLKSICRNIRNSYYQILVFCIFSAVCYNYLERKCDYTLSFALFSMQLWADNISNNNSTAYPPNFFENFLLFFTPAVISKEYQPVKQPGFYPFHELFNTFISIRHPFSEENATLLKYLSAFFDFSEKNTSINIGSLYNLLYPEIYYEFWNPEFQKFESSSPSGVIFF